MFETGQGGGDAASSQATASNNFGGGNEKIFVLIALAVVGLVAIFLARK